MLRRYNAVAPDASRKILGVLGLDEFIVRGMHDSHRHADTSEVARRIVRLRSLQLAYGLHEILETVRGR
jgi:hypothetical protein